MRWIILVFTTLLLFFSCKKIERINPVDGIVGVQTSAVQQLDLSSVQIGSTLQLTEEVPYVTQRGVCWSTNPNPTTANDFVAQGNGFGTFQSKISGLAANTIYYFRSFASNEKTTAYGNEVSFTTSSNLSISITDSDGNSYKTVTIGTQTWMAENLKTSKYSDGTTIPNITDNTQWSNLSTGAWCYYDNNSANNSKYGKLYNWYAVSPTTNGNKNVCPTGWHVPTDAEWTVLTEYLGGESVAGGKMKEVGTTNWNSPNTGATNKSLFTGLPGGVRNDDLSYHNVGSSGYWWSSSEDGTILALIRSLQSPIGGANSYYFYKKDGISVRCLRD